MLNLVVHIVTTEKRAGHRPAIQNVSKMMHHLGTVILNSFVAVCFVLRIIFILGLFNSDVQPEKLHVCFWCNSPPGGRGLLIHEVSR